MTTLEARVVIIEDGELDQKRMSRDVVRSGSEVVGQAMTLHAALELIGKIPELGADIVLLDFNLTEGDRSGEDGKKILEAIRKKAPTTKVICVSSGAYDDFGDYDLGKNTRNIGAVISELMMGS